MSKLLTGMTSLTGLFSETRISGHKQRDLRSEAFDQLSDPVFLIDITGSLVDANSAGTAFLARLPEEGSLGALGKRELRELFSRSFGKRLSPNTFRVDEEEGPRFFDARSSNLTPSITILKLYDVSPWKMIIAEKEGQYRERLSALERPKPVCAACGAIRNENGKWSGAGAADSMEIPAERRSHGLCPRCLAKALERAAST